MPESVVPGRCALRGASQRRGPICAMDGAGHSLDVLFASLVVQILDPPLWYRVLIKLFGKSWRISLVDNVMAWKCRPTSFFMTSIRRLGGMPASDEDRDVRDAVVTLLGVRTKKSVKQGRLTS